MKCIVSAGAWLLYMVFVCLSICSCDRTREYPTERVLFDFSSISLMRVSDSMFHNLAIICFDEDSTVLQVNQYDSDDFFNGELQADMMIGSYKTLFVANVEPENIWVEKGMSLHDIRYYLPQEDKMWKEPMDVSSAFQKVEVKYDRESQVSVDMKRHIAWIQLKILNIPKDVTKIMVELENVPLSINYDGTIRFEHEKMQKLVTLPSTGDSLQCDIYTYPFEKDDKVKLNMYYERNSVTYYASYLLQNALMQNQMMQLIMNYSEAMRVGINPNREEWGDTIVEGEIEIGSSDEVVADNRPVKGRVSTVNLLTNGGFESEELEDWGFSEISGKDNVVIGQSEVVREGNRAVRLEGKTYLFQDVSVTERKGYQLKLPVNALSKSTEWRCFCTWRKTKSAALGTSFNVAIQTLERTQTEGWINVFADGVDMFRAPVGAKYLRIEFRTYSEKEEGVGLCLDGLGVYEVEE